MPGRESERRSSSVLISASHLRETGLIGRSFCASVCGFFIFRTGRKQFQQHTVTLPFELCDRAAVGLLGHTFDDGLLHFGTELRYRAEIFPPGGQWPCELLHEMLDSAWTTAQMEQQIWTHQAPTQSRSPAHGRVRVSDVQYTLLDEVDDFTVKSSLKPVCDMADDFLPNMDRFLTDRGVEGDGPLDGLWRCFGTCNDLDQRNDVGGIERVTDHAPLRILACRLHHTHRQTR